MNNCFSYKRIKEWYFNVAFIIDLHQDLISKPPILHIKLLLALYKYSKGARGLSV